RFCLPEDEVVEPAHFFVRIDPHLPTLRDIEIEAAGIAPSAELHLDLPAWLEEEHGLEYRGESCSEASAVASERRDDDFRIEVCERTGKRLSYGEFGLGGLLAAPGLRSSHFDLLRLWDK